MNNMLREGLLHKEADKDWFVDSRFGMFIHFGLYSLAARHEWVQSFEKIPSSQYDRYFRHFDPDLYDPRDLARRAKAAGMKYVVITTKHHEGFCLWDTAETDYKAPNTPFKRDALRLAIDAFLAEGLRIGLYYSLLDWHHPDFTADIYHPERDRAADIIFDSGYEMDRYRQYMQAQIRELLTGYGRIDLLWFDFTYPDLHYRDMAGKGYQEWGGRELAALARELQPSIIINNRLCLPDSDGPPDLTTPEQYVPQTRPMVNGAEIAWEACHTLSGSWGYFRDEESWKSPEQLIQLLIESVALGGNLLMNVGPNGRGMLDFRAIEALDHYTAWIGLHGRSIYGCGAATGIATPRDCRLTQRGNRLYVHVFNWPFRHLHIAGLHGRADYAQFLHDGSEVTWVNPEEKPDINVGVVIPAGMLTLELPVKKPSVLTPVIEIYLKS